MKFCEAVKNRDAVACARFVELIRVKYRGRYPEVLETAQRVDPTLTPAEWDSLIREGEAEAEDADAARRAVR